MIKKQGSKYVLYTKSGAKVLGYHRTRASAEKQEKAIQVAKHKRKRYR